MAIWRRPCFEIKVLGVWIYLIWERIGIARNVGGAPEDNNFTLTASKSVHEDISVSELLEICLSENERRMSGTIGGCSGAIRTGTRRWALQFIRPRRPGG